MKKIAWNAVCEAIGELKINRIDAFAIGTAFGTTEWPNDKEIEAFVAAAESLGVSCSVAKILEWAKAHPKWGNKEICAECF